MLRKTLSIAAAVLGCTLVSQIASGTFIPPEDIKNPIIVSDRDANMTKDQFDSVIEKGRAFYEPIVASHGAKLVMNPRWDDDTLNASASQSGGRWNVNMYGGLARHPEMTLDGFAMVLCHELGHHLAGFSFKKSFFATWASNEGQSDYFAAHSCSRALWEDEKEVNASFRGKINKEAAARCDAVWETTENQDLCYRVNAGGQSLARVLASLGHDPKKDPNGPVFPEFETPSANKVNKTNDRHPQAQCRLDTTYAASVCTAQFDHDLIPGKKMSDKFGTKAEKEASTVSCMEISEFEEGLRPRCWFKPGV